MSAIEALYIFDEHNNLLLEHIYTGRPPSPSILLPLYLAHPTPRPSLTYHPHTHPPTLLHALLQDRLLFLAPCSTDVEPLAVAEFLHRVADALEDFLGSPLLASRIEGSYDVVAQLLGEMCDAGIVATTETNPLRDVVEAPSWVRSLLGSAGLPGSSPALNTSTPTPSFSPRPSLRPSLRPSPGSSGPPPPPWRRQNVRHTSNELYVDIIETLLITISPSGLPLSATANGTLAFTSKVSGIPDLLLVLSAKGGGGVEAVFENPVFHPCVRLKRWRERPGELSFVPPDGRFVLAGYGVDLLGRDYLSDLSRGTDPGKAQARLGLPATLDVRTGLGSRGEEFEVRLSLNSRFFTKGPTSSAGGSFPSSASSGSGFGSGNPSTAAAGRPKALPFAVATRGDSAAPSLSDVMVRVPVPPGVRNLVELRVSRGEAVYAPGDRAVEWRVGAKDVAAMQGGGGVTLRTAVVGVVDEREEGEGAGGGVRGETWEYDDDTAAAAGGYQAAEVRKRESVDRDRKAAGEQRDAKAVRRNALLMPSSATLSFRVKGWLASGIKVERLSVDAKASRGLGAGVQPYKGVKYLSVSDEGIEVRC